MALTGVGHIALTVTDLQRGRAWYERVLGWSAVAEGTGDGVRFAVGSVPDGLLIGLREYDAADGVRFDPRRVGLDHLAFSVAAEELGHWEQRFTELDVPHDAVQEPRSASS